MSRLTWESFSLSSYKLCLTIDYTLITNTINLPMQISYQSNLVVAPTLSQKAWAVNSVSTVGIRAFRFSHSEHAGRLSSLEIFLEKNPFSRFECRYQALVSLFRERQRFDLQTFSFLHKYHLKS